MPPVHAAWFLSAALVGGCQSRPSFQGPDRAAVRVSDGGAGGRTAMHSAARWDDVPAMARLARRGADVDARDDGGATPLFEAARYARPGAVRWLLAHGAEVNAQAADGTTPLLLASRDSRPPDAFLLPLPGPETTKLLDEVALLLLQRGADPDRAMVEGRTPLHAAASAGNARLVRRLLDAGAHVDVVSRSDGTPLRAGAESGSAEVVRTLFDAGAHPRPPSPDERVRLLIAAARRPDVLSIVLDMWADASTSPAGPPGPGDAALVSAARSLQPRSARMLMGAGVTSGRALGSALLAVGQPPWERPAGYLPETTEKRARRLETVRLLLDTGAPADGCGGALLGAAVNGHEPVVALLRERGATASLPDEMQMRRTWFTLAVLDRREEASALVRLGLRPDLNAAAAFGDARRVREILAGNPAVARAALPGTTSLVLAARAGHLEIVDVLLAAGAPADGTVRTNGKWPATPLEAAASRGRLDVMRRLIDAGADVNGKDANGKTLLKRVLQNPPDYPEFHPTPAVADLLRHHGAVE